jgi:hypothetical protein
MGPPYNVEIAVHVWQQLVPLQPELVADLRAELQFVAHAAAGGQTEFSGKLILGDVAATYEVSHSRRTVSLLDVRLQPPDVR